MQLPPDLYWGITRLHQKLYGHSLFPFGIQNQLGIGTKHQETVKEQHFAHPSIPHMKFRRPLSGSQSKQVTDMTSDASH